MLWNILEAYDGELPDDIQVVFSNTGLEHRETYEFIHRIEENWTSITWLEYTLNEEGKHWFKTVDYHSASRNGSPFTTLLEKQPYLPNPVARVCTLNLKLRTLPEQLDWWIDTEEKHKHTFRKDRPNYASIKRHAHLQQAFDFGDTIDCFCTD